MWQQVGPLDFPQFPPARFSVSFFLDGLEGIGTYSIMQLAFFVLLFADRAIYLRLNISEVVGFAFVLTKKGIYGILLYDASVHDMFLHASIEVLLCPLISLDSLVTIMPPNEDWIKENGLVEEHAIQDILQMARWLI